MDKKNKLSNIWPVIVLYILSPVIAELLFGSTPASRSGQLIFESFFYGSGALLIRDIARRYKLGWTSVIVFGIAFGVIEECLLLQSAFNPHFLGNDLSFGRTVGVNWVWAEFIIGYHSIWSITIPVLLTELVFPDKSNQPWLSKTGLGITSGIYILSCVAFYTTFQKLTGFSTSFIHYLISGLVALALIALAFNLPSNRTIKYKLKIRSSFITGLIAFGGSIFWLFLFSLIFKQGSGLPAWIIEALGAVTILVMTFLIAGGLEQIRSDKYRFSLAFGCLMASLLFGLFVLIQSNNILDQVCQIIFIAISVGLLILLKRRRLN